MRRRGDLLSFGLSKQHPIQRHEDRWPCSRTSAIASASAPCLRQVTGVPTLPTLLKGAICKPHGHHVLLLQGPDKHGHMEHFSCGHGATFQTMSHVDMRMLWSEHASFAMHERSLFLNNRAGLPMPRGHKVKARYAMAGTARSWPKRKAMDDLVRCHNKQCAFEMLPCIDKIASEPDSSCRRFDEQPQFPATRPTLNIAQKRISQFSASRSGLRIGSLRSTARNQQRIARAHQLWCAQDREPVRRRLSSPAQRNRARPLMRCRKLSATVSGKGACLLNHSAPGTIRAPFPDAQLPPCWPTAATPGLLPYSTIQQRDPSSPPGQNGTQ